jgi:hypothetical protein
MTFASTMQTLLLSSTLCLTLTGAARAEPAASPEKAPPPPPKLLLKNAQSIRVTLGYKRHEPASGIRPEKGVWNVVAKTDLTGSSAELVDLTPNATRSRWQVAVQGDKLVLDARRFIPSHVYQLDVRKEKRLVGTVLVYLYPPPSDGTEKVEFKEEEEAASKKGASTKKGESTEVARVPKGDL